MACDEHKGKGIPSGRSGHNLRWEIAKIRNCRVLNILDHHRVIDAGLLGGGEEGTPIRPRANSRLRYTIYTRTYKSGPSVEVDVRG